MTERSAVILAVAVLAAGELAGTRAMGPISWFAVAFVGFSLLLGPVTDRGKRP